MSTQRSMKLREGLLGMARGLEDEMKSMDDLMLSTVLESILAAEQQRMRPENFAALCGVAAVLIRRWTDAMPGPSLVTEDGIGLYSAEDIAKRLGITVEEAERVIEEFVDDHPEFARLADPDLVLHRVN